VAASCPENQNRRYAVSSHNEEAVQVHKQEIHRQGYRNYTNTDQPGDVRYINAIYKGRSDLQVPIDNSSTTPGVFTANPHRPTFNPCTQRSLYKNKRYLKHKRNRKYKDIQYKFTYKQQQEREQKPEQKKNSEEVLKRKSRKGKDQ
jgi:hypothetical protein